MSNFFNSSFQTRSNKSRGTALFDSFGTFVCVPELLVENNIMFKIDLSKMTAGVYYMQISKGKRRLTKRIVKK